MIPFFDNTRQYKSLKKELEPKILKLLRSGKYVSGEKVEEFEKNLAEYCDTKYAVCVNSGTMAIQLALESLDLEGSDILVPSLTFYATIEAIKRAGATPVYIDIDEYYCIDTNQIREYLQMQDLPLVRAILPVHLYGQCANMTEILKIAQEYDLHVIEDACQSIGATHFKNKAGSMGNAGCFSFYPSKNLGAFGEGGAIVTNDECLYETCKALRNHGQTFSGVHEYMGLNGRMSEIQALILNHKLSYLDSYIEKRQSIAQIYNEKLKDFVEIPKTLEGNTHTYHLYVVRGDIKEKLEKEEIGYGVHYPLACHEIEKRNDELPHTNEIKDIVSLPMFPELIKKEIERVCEVIRDEM